MYKGYSSAHYILTWREDIELILHLRGKNATSNAKLWTLLFNSSIRFTTLLIILEPKIKKSYDGYITVAPMSHIIIQPLLKLLTIVNIVGKFH
jgi:hypothetical protein